MKKREDNFRKIWKTYTAKFVPRLTIKMRTRMEEERSDSLLTLKFYCDLLFLTTKNATDTSGTCLK